MNWILAISMMATTIAPVLDEDPPLFDCYERTCRVDLTGSNPAGHVQLVSMTIECADCCDEPAWVELTLYNPNNYAVDVIVGQADNGSTFFVYLDDTDRTIPPVTTITIRVAMWVPCNSKAEIAWLYKPSGQPLIDYEFSGEGRAFRSCGIIWCEEEQAVFGDDWSFRTLDPVTQENAGEILGLENHPG